MPGAVRFAARLRSYNGSRCPAHPPRARRGTIGNWTYTQYGVEEPKMNFQESQRPERPMTPYRWLVAAALLSIMLAQMVAMVMVTRSQVLRAEVREAAERHQARTMGSTAVASSGARPVDASSSGLITVGLSAAR
jgi:hypothetical protein